MDEAILEFAGNTIVARSDILYKHIDAAIESGQAKKSNPTVSKLVRILESLTASNSSEETLQDRDVLTFFGLPALAAIKCMYSHTDGKEYQLAQRIGDFSQVFLNKLGDTFDVYIKTNPDRLKEPSLKTHSRKLHTDLKTFLDHHDEHVDLEDVRDFFVFLENYNSIKLIGKYVI